MKIVEKAAKAIKQSKIILIGAGAGMGKDSGMPDFRGNQGFWNNYPPYKNKFSFVECANPDFLENHPHLFWGFYGSRLNMYRQTKPHKGFQILKQISEQKEDHFIITSNVDGHFQKVYEVHGSINHLQCSYCGKMQENYFEPKVNFETMSCQNLPKCKECNKNMRPNILMFGDWDWDSSRSDEQSRKYDKFLKKAHKKTVVIELGCGTAVPTIRNMCERAYYNNKDSVLIRINPDEDSAHKWMDKERYVYVKMGALEALEEIKRFS